MALQIIRNDITKVSADAIVNTANPNPIYSSGTDGAVYAAAGAEQLLAERKKIGTIETGKAFSTPAFALDAKYIIHTVGPLWSGGDHDEFSCLRSCYDNSLKLAAELGCESIAFPLISTGVYGFPKDEALKIAISSFTDFLTDHDMDIILVVFDEESFVLSGKIFSDVDEFIDDNYVDEQIEEEYGSHYTYDGIRDSAPIPTAEKSRGGLASIFRREGKGRSDRTGSAKKSTPEPADQAMSVPIFSAPVEESQVDHEEMPAPGAPVFANSSAMSLDDRVAHLSDTWQESLLHIIDEKGYKDTEVYKRANVDRKLFSKIRSNPAYQPKKITAVAFALALRLNLDETKDLLSRAGYALSPSSKFDLIVEYFIEHEVYDTYTINLALFKHEQPILGE